MTSARGPNSYSGRKDNYSHERTCITCGSRVSNATHGDRCWRCMGTNQGACNKSTDWGLDIFGNLFRLHGDV